MDGMIYPLALAVLGILAFMFFQNHSEKLALLMVLIGVYLVYSHETGYTATDFRNETVESLGESADEWAKNHGTEGYDASRAEKAVK